MSISYKYVAPTERDLDGLRSPISYPRAKALGYSLKPFHGWFSDARHGVICYLLFAICDSLLPALPHPCETT